MLLRIFLRFQVVDTSQLIKSEQQIRSTTRTACILKNGLLYERVTSSPEKSFLGKIFEKTKFGPEMKEEQKLFGERCLLTFDMSNESMYTNMLKLASSPYVFMVGEQDAAHLVMSTISLLRGYFKKAWVLEDAIYPYNLVFYHNPDKRRRIGWE